jgi:hypothetical protein
MGHGLSICHPLCSQEEPEAGNAVADAPGTEPQAQAASAPAILNRAAWPEHAKEASLSLASGMLHMICAHSSLWLLSLKMPNLK